MEFLCIVRDTTTVVITLLHQEIQDFMRTEKADMGFRRKFSARRRWYTWLTNAILFYLCFVVAPWPIVEKCIGGTFVEDRSNTVYFLLALCPVVGFVTIMFATRSYSVTKGYVEIHLVGSSFSVCMDKIEAVNRIHWLSTFFCFRFGFGGFGEYFGLFWFSRLGKVTAFVTNRHDLVLIEKRNGKKLLISPAQPDEFVDLVRNAKEQNKTQIAGKDLL